MEGERAREPFALVRATPRGPWTTQPASMGESSAPHGPGFGDVRPAGDGKRGADAM